MNDAMILLVEDDVDILETNRDALEMKGYRVVTAETLAQAKACLEREEPDLIVLDITLPDGNGLEYSEELRGGGVRILFLSALNTKEDTLVGLDAGGDDYLTKPYLIAELLARVDVLMRRGKLIGENEPPLRLGRLEINFTSRRAILDGEDLLLSPKEFTVLEILARNRGKFLPPEELYQKVWGMDAADNVQTVWEHISKLRRKLSGDARIVIENERGKGYRLKMGN